MVITKECVRADGVFVIVGSDVSYDDVGDCNRIDHIGGYSGDWRIYSGNWWYELLWHSLLVVEIDYSDDMKVDMAPTTETVVIGMSGPI